MSSHAIKMGGNAKKSLPALSEAIHEILESRAGDTVKLKALDTLTAVFGINNVSISGCTFHQHQSNDPDDYPEEEDCDCTWCKA